jgi:hypothetical protein
VGGRNQARHRDRRSVPFRYLIQHLGVGDQEFSERTRIDAAFLLARRTGVFAQQRGVEILLENTPQRARFRGAPEAVQRIDAPELNYVFDTGHAHIVAGIEHEFEIMRRASARCTCTITTASRRSAPLPHGPEGGTIDWKRTMELLRSRPGQYPLLLELREVPGNGSIRSTKWSGLRNLERYESN